MDQQPERKPVKYTLGANLSFVNMTVEGEFLRKQARQLREEFTREKRDELFTAIYEGHGNADTLRAQAELDYYLAMFQVNSSERGARQLAIGTWVLAVATVGLLVATIILAVTTAKS
jgi:hypothetical protein